MIQKIINRIKNIANRFNFSNNQILGTFIKKENVTLSNVEIKLGVKAKLTLLEGVKIHNYKIVIEEGELIIGENTILEQGNSSIIPSIYISSGKLEIGHHNVIKAEFCIRFDGHCTIGNYNCLNELTEVRCDERIDIGDFNLISYECMIYDTNTHFIYPPIQRRKITTQDFPAIGIEREKPMTKPIIIGNDCWIGKRAVVLKGCIIGNEAILSACSVVTKSVPAHHMAYGNPALIKSKVNS